MWIRIKNFLRRWGLWVALGIGALALGIRRAAVLHALSRLRLRLTEKTQELDDAKHGAAVEEISKDIEAHAANVKRLERERAQLEGAVARAEEEHARIVGEIDKAKSWNELEKLRQEGNARGKH